MSNTPCAYAVSSVLHRRVEIKVERDSNALSVTSSNAHSLKSALEQRSVRWLLQNSLVFKTKE